MYINVTVVPFANEPAQYTQVIVDPLVSHIDYINVTFSVASPYLFGTTVNITIDPTQSQQMFVPTDTRGIVIFPILTIHMNSISACTNFTLQFNPGWSATSLTVTDLTSFTYSLMLNATGWHNICTNLHIFA